ncbi:MAG: hypothetical protein J6D13_08750 [Clostridium sp.]|nr:hypothetical protein [Clostridium sp.]
MAITFDNIAGGELAAKFSMALAQIGRNILDPNMDPDAARGMTINLKFKPSKAGAINVDFDIKTKLAGMAKSETVFLVGQDARTGRIEMSEYGNNRPMVAGAYDAVPVVPRAEPGGVGKTFDPETGEIIEPAQTGPIDLRNMK